MPYSFRGGEAVRRLVEAYAFDTVLDVGSGEGTQARALTEHGKTVTETDYSRDGDFNEIETPGKFDVVFACHVLEHQPNPGQFLRRCRECLVENGLLVVTVPPAKHEIVGGHLTLWNAGLLCYNLILAGFDCSEAEVLQYGYNITVIVRHTGFEPPVLRFDNGDIETLAPYFPVRVTQGFDGRLNHENILNGEKL